MLRTDGLLFSEIGAPLRLAYLAEWIPHRALAFSSACGLDAVGGLAAELPPLSCRLSGTSQPGTAAARDAAADLNTSPHGVLTHCYLRGRPRRTACGKALLPQGWAPPRWPCRRWPGILWGCPEMWGCLQTHRSGPRGFSKLAQISSRVPESGIKNPAKHLSCQPDRKLQTVLNVPGAQGALESASGRVFIGFDWSYWLWQDHGPESALLCAV